MEYIGHTHGGYPNLNLKNLSSDKWKSPCRIIFNTFGEILTVQSFRTQLSVWETCTERKILRGERFIALLKLNEKKNLKTITESLHHILSWWNDTDSITDGRISKADHHLALRSKTQLFFIFLILADCLISLFVLFCFVVGKQFWSIPLCCGLKQWRVRNVLCQVNSFFD